MIFLVVTIDVEPDCSLSWHYSDPLTFDGVRTGIRQTLQPLFEKYNIIPTYLINNVVLEDSKSVGIFRNLAGKFELGAHLHPEFIGPDKKYSNYAGMKGEDNQCLLKPGIEFAKMENLTKLFMEKFGFQPTSFRAGRFMAGPNTISSLKKLGYKVDTSITPHTCWNDKTRQSPVDFRAAYEQPYFVKEKTILEKDENGSILEVPLTVVKTKRLFRTKLKGLRPGFSDYADFMEITNYSRNKYCENKFVVLNMMFHNVEVVPGKSPYTKTEADCKRYCDDLERFFAYCRDSSVKSVGLTELFRIYDDLRRKN